MTTTIAQGYAFYEPDCHRHYQEHYGEHNGAYEQYRPAYRYGYDLGVHMHYGAGIWEQIELETRTLWEARNPGTWAQFKDSIQYAWGMAQPAETPVSDCAGATELA